jgi:hypothetical protein
MRAINRWLGALYVTGERTRQQRSETQQRLEATSGGRKPPIQVHGSWEAEDDGFFTGGWMQQQIQQDEEKVSS